MDNEVSGPDMNQHPAAAEGDLILAARAARDRCACGGVHEDGNPVTSEAVARMRAYLAANPGHRFAVDDEAGIVAVIIAPGPGTSGPPQILAWSEELNVLLDEIGAPAAAAMS